MSDQKQTDRVVRDTLRRYADMIDQGRAHAAHIHVDVLSEDYSADGYRRDVLAYGEVVTIDLRFACRRMAEEATL